MMKMVKGMFDDKFAMIYGVPEYSEEKNRYCLHKIRIHFHNVFNSWPRFINSFTLFSQIMATL